MVVGLVSTDAAHTVNEVIDGTDALSLPRIAHVRLALNLLCLYIDLNVYLLYDKVPIILCFAGQIVPTNHVDVSVIDLNDLWPHCPSELFLLFLPILLHLCHLLEFSLRKF